LDRRGANVRLAAARKGGDIDRSRTPAEFGFTTPSYLPPERARPIWQTLVFGALLALIPLVGAGVSAVYIDRRKAPGTYDFGATVKTALIQIVAFASLAVIGWLVFGLLFGIGRSNLNPGVSGPPG
jgi:hypothetical protein